VSPRLPPNGGLGDVLNLTFWFHAWSQDGRNQHASLRVDAAAMATAQPNSTFADYLASGRDDDGGGGGRRAYNWTQVWRVSGSQGDRWVAASVLLPRATERIRFVATSGDHWQSDVAIDDLLVRERAVF
jgi:hypothetical protein